MTKAVACAMAFALFGCDKPAERTDHDAHSSWGPTMPLRVGAEGLSFPVADLLLPGEACLGATYASAVGANDTLDIEDGLVVLDAAPASGVGNLSLILEGGTRDVPILSRGEVSHTFRHRLNDASQTVGIVGNLNGWTPEPMEPSVDNPGTFERTAIFSPGKHPYQLVIDGEWVLDPNNDNTLSNGMGGWMPCVYL